MLNSNIFWVKLPMLTGLNSLIYWKEKHIQNRMDVFIANSKARDADHTIFKLQCLQNICHNSRLIQNKFAAWESVGRISETWYSMSKTSQLLSRNHSLSAVSISHYLNMESETKLSTNENTSVKPFWCSAAFLMHWNLDIWQH